MNKVRPCIILSPTEANKHFLTVISAPITNTDLGFVALDQMGALNKTRFCDKVGCLSGVEIKAI